MQSSVLPCAHTNKGSAIMKLYVCRGSTSFTLSHYGLHTCSPWLHVSRRQLPCKVCYCDSYEYLRRRDLRLVPLTRWTDWIYLGAHLGTLVFGACLGKSRSLLERSAVFPSSGFSESLFLGAPFHSSRACGEWQRWKERSARVDSRNRSWVSEKF
jgi:hypothetical protein